jgi:hypothetical protein
VHTARHGAALGGALDVLLELGEAKIGHLDVPLVVEQQVERLEVAVHDARRVEEVHALGRLVGHLHLQHVRDVRHELILQQLLIGSCWFVVTANSV